VRGGRRLVPWIAAAVVLAALASLATVETSEVPTIEQVLAPADVAGLARVRDLFGREPDVVLVAVRRRGAPLSAARLAEFAARVDGLDGVARAWPPGADGFGRPDPSTGVILVELEAGAASLTRARALAATLDRALAEEARPDETVHVTGAPEVRVASWEAAQRDLRRALPLLVAVVVVVPLLFFGSFTAILFPLLLAALTTALTLLAFRLVQGPLNALTLLLVPLVWSVATLDAMHLYSRARLRGSFARARAELAWPCLLTSLTTAGGFLALAAQGESRLLRAFGAWAAAGTGLAWVLTFAAGGLLLGSVAGARRPPRWPARFALAVVRASGRRAGLVRVAFVGATVVAALLSTRVRVGVAFPDVFAAGEPAARELAAVEEITGTDLAPLDLCLEPSDERGRAPASLATALLALSHYVGTFPETRAVLPRDLLAAAPVRAATLGELQADPRLAPWIRLDRGAGRVQVHFAPMPLARRDELLAWLRHFDATMLDHHRLLPGGPGYLYPLAEHRGVHGAVVGGLLSLAVVAATLAFVFRRPRALAVALLANVLPLLFVAGLMGALGRPWSLALLPLPAILFALAVDDTLHLLWAARGRAVPARAHVERGALRAGPAVLATTAVLAACVGTLLPSGLQANRDLALLLPAGLLLALLCDLAFVPAWLRGPRRRSARPSP